MNTGYQYTRCAVCGEVIWQEGPGRRRATCSDACRKALSRARRAGMEPREYVTRRGEKRVREWEQVYGPFESVGRWDPMLLREKLIQQVTQRIRVPRCKQCERPYRNGSGPGGGFCTKTCKRTYRIEVKQVKALADQRRVRLVGKKRRMGLCAWCGAPVGEIGGQQQYCGSACRQAAYRARWGTCPVCGDRFAREQWGAEVKIYCSGRCRRKHQKAAEKDRRHARARSPKACRECGAMFIDASTRPGRQVYCGSRCKGRAAYHRRREASGEIREGGVYT